MKAVLANPSKPRVLILNDTDAFAGTEQYIFALACGLHEAGENVAVACPDQSPLAQRLHAAGQEVVGARPAFLNIRALRKIVPQLRSGETNILHANNGNTALFAAVALSLAGRGLCVSTQHFLEPAYLSRKGFKAKASNAAHQWVDRRISHVIAISNATRLGTLARGEGFTDKITVIANGIAAPDLQSLRSVQSIRVEAGVAAETPLLVCAARLEPEKDVSTLIDAMELVVQSIPNAVCVIAGEGRLRDQLHERVDRKGLQQSVRLLGFRNDVRSIMRAADLFVLPSVAEPFGLVLIEAMSLGKPVIATRAGGPLEIVDDGRTGILVQPGNAAEMAAAITRILGSVEMRLQMGQLGHEKFCAEFTVQRMAQETLTVYRRVLAKPEKPPAASISNPSDIAVE